MNTYTVEVEVTSRYRLEILAETEDAAHDAVQEYPTEMVCEAGTFLDHTCHMVGDVINTVPN